MTVMLPDGMFPAFFTNLQMKHLTPSRWTSQQCNNMTTLVANMEIYIYSLYGSDLFYWEYYKKGNVMDVQNYLVWSENNVSQYDK